MKYILLCGWVIVGFLVNAQITITSSDMPEAGDTLRYSTNFSPENFPYDTTGAGITWDFSNLTPQTQGLYEYKFGLFINPVYSGFFGFNSFGLKIADQINLGVIQFDNIYNFYRTTSTAFRAEGFGLEISNVPVPADYTEPDKVYQFPLEYNDRDSSTYRLAFSPDNNTHFVRKGYRVNEVDGYGTVITPHGTFDCLRIKVLVRQTDSIGNNNIPFPLEVTQTTINYVWLAKGERAPIVEVQGSISPFNGNYNATQLRYRDTYRNLNPNAVEEVDFSRITLFPNPTVDAFAVEGISKPELLTIFDLQGKLVVQKQVVNSETISIAHLNSGVYFVQIGEGNKSATYRLLKLK